MPDPDYPPAEQSLARLHRSGWSTGEAAFTGLGGRSGGFRVIDSNTFAVISFFL
jgi:hypothetical protein